MALPIWIWPAAKKAGIWLITNGPPLVELGKKYGPPVLGGYREHGLKPLRIASFVQAELTTSAAKPAGPKRTAKRRQMRPTKKSG